MDPAVVIQLLSLVVATVVLALMIVGLAAKSRREILETVTAQHNTLISEIRRIDEEQDAIRSQTGEAVASIRHEVGQLGFFIRDNYVRESVFTHAVGGVREAVRVMGDKIEARCLRMELAIQNGLAVARRSTGEKEGGGSGSP